MKDIGMSRTTKIVVAVGAAFAALVLVVVVLVTASQPDKRTCAEWIQYAMTTEGFESNIGPACMFGEATGDLDPDPTREYTLEELEEISEEVEKKQGEDGLLGPLPEHEYQDLPFGAVCLSTQAGGSP